MPWNKSISGQKITYTLMGTDPSRPMVNRIIYDPTATPKKRWIWECSYMFSATETVVEIERALGL